MPKNVRVVCDGETDGKPCGEFFDGSELAQADVQGWVRRTIVDTLGPAQPGDSEFSGQQVLYFCPGHAEQLTGPPLAETVEAELARREVAAEQVVPGDG